MITLDDLIGDGGGAAAEGIVQRAPASNSDTIDVSTAASVGDLLTSLRWGPERVGHLPAVGDPVLILWPVTGDPWVVCWWPYAG